MKRRAALSGFIALLSIVLPNPAWAVSLVDLKGLGEAIDAASEAFGKLADSVGHAATLGDRGFSVLAARHTRDLHVLFDIGVIHIASSFSVALK